MFGDRAGRNELWLAQFFKFLKCNFEKPFWSDFCGSFEFIALHSLVEVDTT